MIDKKMLKILLKILSKCYANEVKGEILIRNASTDLVNKLPVPNGLTFEEAIDLRDNIVNRILNKVR